jgi:hypothetical protein
MRNADQRGFLLGTDLGYQLVVAGEKKLQPIERLLAVRANRRVAGANGRAFRPPGGLSGDC